MRPVRPAEATFVRELEEADLGSLAARPSQAAPAISRLRDSHHGLARALAAGMRPAEASLVTGYSLSRISILQADTSFRELLEFYRANVDAAFASVQDRMSTLSMDSLAELQERLESAPEEFTPNMLLEIATRLADRTGHAPTSRSVNLNLSGDIGDLAKQLEKARKRIEAEQSQPQGDPSEWGSSGAGSPEERAIERTIPTLTLSAIETEPMPTAGIPPPEHRAAPVRGAEEE